MPMLTCIHHVSWLKPVEGGKHQCSYCKATLAKKDIYPKFDDLGPEFQQRWDAHEKGEPSPPALAPAPVPAGGLTHS